MTRKWISSIMAGVFIALGAMVYLSIPNAIAGSLFFSTGIFLVLNLHNMLFTRVCPLTVYSQYRWTDMAVAWAGNGVGALLAAIAVFYTRFGNTVGEAVKKIGEAKLGDDPVSLFIMGIFCAFFVAVAVLVGAEQEQGSFAQIFYVWLFITAFVYCGFEHIVADMFYLSCYALNYGAEILDIIKVLLSVTAGNIAGGLFFAWAVKRLRQEEQKNLSH